MKKAFLSKVIAAAFTLALFAAASHDAFGAARIVILNNDAANTGFNDPTPVGPVGNNTGTTLGQQRLNAFQFAANIWGATISSSVTITIRANWAPLQCSPTSGVLGQAGSVGIFRNFPNAPLPNTWYSAALANALSGSDLDLSLPDINATFNSSVGSAGCLDSGGQSHFYLGLDNNHGGDIDLVSVLIHEFAHGLGFQTFTNTGTGAQMNGQDGTPSPSIYDQFLVDDSTGKIWVQMTDAERQASAINTGNLAWNGPQTTGDLRGVLGTPRLRVNAPAAIAGNYAVGTADFGPHVSTSGTTANVSQASPADGCSALTNGAAVSGRLALIDRGNCTFVVKVKNAQNAGAVGVIIANNQTSPAVIQMGGGDATITIPTLMISQADGNTLKGQLGSGLNATLLLDNSALGGVDGQGRALMFAPNPVQSGSSVSHWDSSLFPNQLMEPNISGDLIHSVAIPADLTGSQLRDVGWSFNPVGDVNFFVRQHYLDFLNRQPDTSGQSFWTNDIFGCGTDQACAEVHRINVSAAFFLSIEFKETGYLVERMYKTAYGDATGNSTLNGPHQLAVPVVRLSEFLPDTQRIGQGVIVGQGSWQQQLEDNKQAFALEFVQRGRFAAAFPPSLTAGEFVARLDQNAGGVLSAGDRAQLEGLFGGASASSNNAAARAAALRQVAESPALNANENNRAFVLIQYFGYLRRNPNDGQDTDYTGYDFWLQKLNQFNGDFVQAQMVKAFLDSTEYRQRFGPA